MAKKRPRIKRLDVGCYELNNIRVGSQYLITTKDEKTKIKTVSK